MKKIISVAVALLLACMVGCGVPVSTSGEEPINSMFVRVERTGMWDVVYHEDTGVMYAVSGGTYNRGTFTLLVNPDGTPMIWEGK